MKQLSTDLPTPSIGVRPGFRRVALRVSFATRSIGLCEDPTRFGHQCRVIRFGMRVAFERVNFPATELQRRVHDKFTALEAPSHELPENIVYRTILRQQLREERRILNRDRCALTQ